jgi:hypothetical protein
MQGNDNDNGNYKSEDTKTEEQILNLAIALCTGFCILAENFEKQ